MLRIAGFMHISTQMEGILNEVSGWLRMASKPERASGMRNTI